VAQVQKQSTDRSSVLGLGLTTLTLVDGNQASISTELIGRRGTSTPRAVQAGTIAGTTAVGAGIGAVAGWGTGAAIGAGAGAAAGIIGVLLTRNHPTVVYPETALTFRIGNPVQISTLHAPQAFRYVGPDDYDRPVQQQLAQRPPLRPGPGPGPAPYYYGGGGYYPYPYPYGYWGPGVAVVWGPGFYGRGFYRRWR
jgi:hypothetical protein